MNLRHSWNSPAQKCCWEEGAQPTEGEELPDRGTQAAHLPHSLQEAATLSPRTQPLALMCQTGT